MYEKVFNTNNNMEIWLVIPDQLNSTCIFEKSEIDENKPKQMTQ